MERLRDLIERFNIDINTEGLSLYEIIGELLEYVDKKPEEIDKIKRLTKKLKNTDIDNSFAPKPVKEWLVQQKPIKIEFESESSEDECEDGVLFDTDSEYIPSTTESETEPLEYYETTTSDDISDY